MSSTETVCEGFEFISTPSSDILCAISSTAIDWITT